MLMHIFSVRDSVAQVFGRPFYSVNAGAAIRAFSDQVNNPDPQNELFAHPSDFELYELGSFDDVSCRIEPLPEPKPLVLGKSVLRPKQP